MPRFSTQPVYNDGGSASTGSNKNQNTGWNKPSSGGSY